MAPSTSPWRGAPRAPTPCEAVSWPAVLAGTVSAAALSLLLWRLGTELGLSTLALWVREGMAANRLDLASTAWIGFTQLVACGLGGYLAGRLRARWSDAPAEEARFCDTVHGVLVWVMACLACVVLLSGAGDFFVGPPRPTDAASEQLSEAPAHGALWLFIALLIGAVFSSLAATLGGRQADAAHPPRAAERLAPQSPRDGTAPWPPR